MMGNNLPLIDFGATETKEKGSFKFEYTVPSLDWFDVIKVEIRPDDYCYFKLERRYGPTWWLIGKNPPADNAKDYRWTEKTIGKILDHDIPRFVEWAKNDIGGSKITEIAAISGSFDILREIGKIRRTDDGK